MRVASPSRERSRVFVSHSSRSTGDRRSSEVHSGPTAPYKVWVTVARLVHSGERILSPGVPAEPGKEGELPLVTGLGRFHDVGRDRNLTGFLPGQSDLDRCASHQRVDVHEHYVQAPGLEHELA